MNRLSRILLCAGLLASLLPPARAEEAADAPYSALEAPVPEGTRSKLTYLGYRFAEDGRILDPEGAALSKAAYESYGEPFVFREGAITEEEFDYLGALGYGFDEESGRFLPRRAQDGAPAEPGRPLSRLDVEHLLRGRYYRRQHKAIETILALSRDPSTLERARLLAQRAAQEPGGFLPRDLAARIAEPSIGAETLQAGLETAHLASTRYWDGTRTLEQLAQNGEPPPVQTQAPPSRFGYDKEAALSRLLGQTVEERLRENPVGAEVLEHFRREDGALRLPAFVLQRQEPNYGAGYSLTNNAVILNARHLGAPLKAAGAPEAETDSPKKLTAYLLAHPDVLKALVEEEDVDIVHELTHAWQNRRDTLILEAARGNAPDMIYVEYEHEANVWQNRYLHQRFLREPEKTAAHPRYAAYLSMLQDFDRWRDAITQDYVARWPALAADFPTAEAVHREGLRATLKLLWESPKDAFRQWEKMKGSQRGHAALESTRSANQARMEAFTQEELPAMRVDSHLAMASLRSGQGDQAGAFNELLWADFHSRPMAAPARERVRALLAPAAVALAYWLEQRAAHLGPHRATLQSLEAWARSANDKELLRRTWHLQAKLPPLVKK